MPNIFFPGFALLTIFCSSRKLCITDARPRKNALANGAMGGGSESSSNYFQSEVRFWIWNNMLLLIRVYCFLFEVLILIYVCVCAYICIYACIQIVFLGIDNIHAMRDSLARLRDYVDTHGTASSDGKSSFLVISATLSIF